MVNSIDLWWSITETNNRLNKMNPQSGEFNSSIMTGTNKHVDTKSPQVLRT